MASSNQQQGDMRSMNNMNWGHVLNPSPSSSLPPKGPSIMLDPFPFQRGGVNNNNNKQQQQQQHQRTSSFVPQATWMEDMLDSPEAPPRKIFHRRSASDTAAFLDIPENLGKIPDGREPDDFAAYRSLAFTPLAPRNTMVEFERLDDEQIMSMFGGGGGEASHQIYAQQQQQQDLQNSRSLGGTSDKRVAQQVENNLSSPSDSNSANDMSIEDGRPGSLNCPKSELDEVQSLNASECVTPNGAKQPTASSHIDPNMDPKRAKRILANRQSAQRSRVRKLQYIAELERSVTALQTEVSALTPQVAYLDHQRILLNVDNNTMKQRIASLMQDKHFKDAHNDSLSRELHRLRQLVQQQQDGLRTQLHELSGMQQQHQPKVETPGTPGNDKNNPAAFGFGLQGVKPEIEEDSINHQADFSSEELQ